MSGIRRAFELKKYRPMPAYLKNCTFFFDKDLSTVTDTGTMIVNDLSACGNHLKQSTSGEKPTFNTTNGLTFDNTNDNLAFDTPIPFCPQNFTWYFRYNRATASVTNSIFVMDTTDTWYNPVGSHPAAVWLYFTTNSVVLYMGSVAVTFSSLASGDISGDHLYTIIADSTNVTLLVDGVQKGQVSTPAGWKVRNYGMIKTISSPIATFQKSNGKFSQFMLFNKALSTEERTVAEAQLTNKTAIPVYTLESIICKGLFGQSNAVGRVSYTSFSSDYQNTTKGQVMDLATGVLKPVGQGGIDVGEGSNGTLENYKSFELPYSYLRSGKTFWLKHGVGSTFLEDQASTANWSITETTYSYALYYKTKIYYKYFTDLVKSLGYNPLYDEDVYMQGEQDATTVSAKNGYPDNQIALINAWRAYTGLSNQFTIMRIYGPPDSSQAYYLDIQAANATVKSTLSNIQIISTDSYTKGDVAHYDVVGILQGGSDLFNKNYIS